MSQSRLRRPRGRASTAWRRYVASYGWRAYALPCLIVITTVVLVRPGDAPHHTAGRAAAAAQPAHRTTTSSAPAAADPAPAKYLWQQRDTGSACTAASPEASTVLVSISLQHAWICDGQRALYDTPVTTGETDNGNQTPVGSWIVQAKQRNRYLTGPGYRDYVKYWIPYNGDFGLHDAAWQTMPFGSPDYRTGGSHGCVHMPTSVIGRVYSWAVPGKTVVTIES